MCLKFDIYVRHLLCLVHILLYLLFLLFFTSKIVIVTIIEFHTNYFENYYILKSTNCKMTLPALTCAKTPKCTTCKIPTERIEKSLNANLL